MIKTIKYENSNQDAVIKKLKEASRNGMEIIHIFGKRNEPVYIEPGKIVVANYDDIKLQLNYVEYASGGIKGEGSGKTYQTISSGDILQIGNHNEIEENFEKLKQEWERNLAT